MADHDEPQLCLEDVPTPDASWDAIWKFALTFNGYHHWGSFEKCAQIANEERDDTLVDLRTCLFFERQRWQYYREDPDEESAPYIRSLVSKIRDRLSNTVP